jgi:HlyD family secretion protein
VRENVVNYQAVLDVDNADGLLRPGMTGTAQIVSAAEKGVLTVPAAALRYRPTGAGADAVAGPRVFVLRDGKPREIAVTPGLSDEVHTVVSKGELAPGDPIIVGERGGTP